MYIRFLICLTHTKKKNGKKCLIHIERQDSFEAAEEIYKRSVSNERIVVLNFANPKTPGGGVRRGAKAQEETLCLRSSLLKSLESTAAAKYYVYNRSLHSFGGSDAMILSDHVEVIRDQKYNYLENSFLVSVLSCAAPMVSPFSHRLEDTTEEEMETLLYRRILSMLVVMISNGFKRVILGAWGCGAFCNDPMVIAKLFQKAFEEIDINLYFEEICFAILAEKSKCSLEAFCQYFQE